MKEKPTIEERARASEKSKSRERARMKEKPTLEERAKFADKLKTGERAKPAMRNPPSGSEPRRARNPRRRERAKKTMKNQAMRREIREAFRSELIEDLRFKNDQVSEAVELYYDSQKLRIMHQNKERSEGTTELVEWFNYWLEVGEKTIYGKLKQWVESDSAPAEAKWAYNLDGIGPVLAAGLAAHIDPAKAQTVSALWKFAGLAPGFDRRTKGIKLPYNARLKVLCFKIGESFVKVSGKDGAFYGHLYQQLKAEELERNEQGRYREAAAAQLKTKKFKDDTVTRKRLESGKLSDAHLHARACRRVVKMFLQGYWVKGREARGLAVSLPWVFGPGGHDKDHFIGPIEKVA